MSELSLSNFPCSPDYPSWKSWTLAAPVQAAANNWAGLATFALGHKLRALPVDCLRSKQNLEHFVRELLKSARKHLQGLFIFKNGRVEISPETYKELGREFLNLWEVLSLDFNGISRYNNFCTFKADFWSKHQETLNIHFVFTSKSKGFTRWTWSLASPKRWCRVWYSHGWLSTNVSQLVCTNDCNSLLDVPSNVSSCNYNILFGLQAKKVQRHTRGNGDPGAKERAWAIISKPLSETKLCTYCNDGRMYGCCLHSGTERVLFQKVRHPTSTFSLVLSAHLADAFHWHWIHSKTTSNLQFCSLDARKLQV